MNILSLIAQLTLDGRGFKAGIKEAQSVSRDFAKDLSGSLKGELAAVFGAGALVAFVKDTLSSIGALKGMAEQSRMTTEEVQKLTIAAEHSRLEWSDVANAERQFNQRRREAAEGNKDLRESFSKYGMTLSDLQNPQLRFIHYLEKTNEAMENFTPEQKAREGAELFDMMGRMGPKLAGFLEHLKKVQDEPIVSDKTIESMDKADKKLAMLHRRLKMIVADKMENPLQMLAGPVNLWRTLRTLYTGSPEPISPSAEKKHAAAPGSELTGPLFEDKLAEKEAKELAKQRYELEQAIFKVQLQQMTATEARTAKEKKLVDALEEINFYEENGFDMTKQRTDAVNMLGGLLNEKQTRPEVASLTRVGQWSGRSFMNAPESPVVAHTKELLGIIKGKMAPAMDSIDGKVVKGGTLTGEL